MRVSFISLNLSQSRTMLSADTCDTSVQYTRCVFRQKNELNSKREKEVGTLRRNLRWNFSHLLGNPSPHMLSVWEKWKYKWRSCQSLLILPRWILCGYQMMLYNAGVLARRILCCLHHPFILLVSRHCQCTKFNIAWYASEEYSASPTLPLPSPPCVLCWPLSLGAYNGKSLFIWYPVPPLCLMRCNVFVFDMLHHLWVLFYCALCARTMWEHLCTWSGVL